MDILKKHNLKATKTRLAILNLLEEIYPLSAEQIYDKLRKDKINLSSIYRNLTIFEEEKLVIRTVGLNSISYYQLNNHNHKHQISCEKCHKTVIIENCPLHEIEEKLEKDTGFEILSHSFEFSGLCKDCKNIEDENSK